MTNMYHVNGLVSDFKTGELIKSEKLLVHVTKDKIGVSVSIASESREIQFSIPFDQMLKDLNGGKRK